MSDIRFAASLVENLKDLVSGNPASTDPRGFRVYGPLKDEHSYMVLVLLNEGVDADAISVSGHKLPIPEEIGRGFLADIKEFPIH